MVSIMDNLIKNCVISKKYTNILYDIIYEDKNN